eukprot:jgi/Ulvmu1/5754/UM025_0008.1
MGVAAEDRRSVRTVVRVRPPINADEASSQCCTVIDNATIRLANLSSVTQMSFHSVLGPDACQADVYRQVEQVADDAWNGVNSSIIAYGQTGSGKTYTMHGETSLWTSGTDSVSEKCGLVPRVAQHLLSQQGNSDDHVMLRCSYCEVYNEKVYDLFASSHTPAKHRCSLSICEDADGITHVRNLLRKPFDRIEKLLQLLAFGAQQRSVRQTALNHHSSRGHTLLQLHVESRKRIQDPSCMRASIVFADLAGSEPHPGGRIVPNSHAAETRCISMSLSALVSVVSSLVSGTRHVPYRDSKLTWLMRHALGGNCHTYVIATVSPCARARAETQSTLQFANRASAVVNNVVQNSCQEFSTLLEMKNDEICRLRAALQQFGSRPSPVPRTVSLQGTSTQEDLQHRILEKKIVTLKQALATERKRVRQLEACYTGTAASSDHDCGWDFGTTFQQRACSGCTAMVMTNETVCMPLRLTGVDAISRRSKNLVPALEMQRSMSMRVPGHSLDHKAVLNRTLASAHTCGAGLRHNLCRVRQGPPAQKKAMSAGSAIRQRGQHSPQNKQAAMHTVASDEIAPVECEYSDAGVAKLMRQYSSLLVELGIKYNVAECIDNAAQTKPLANTLFTQAGSPPVESFEEGVDFRQSTLAGDCATKLHSGPIPFGLSEVVAHKHTKQHGLPQWRSNPTRSAFLPNQGSGFGLSGILNGTTRRLV